MGLPNFDKYRLSSHAIERYQERIDSRKGMLDILKEFRGWTREMEFLCKSSSRTEIWLVPSNEIVVVLSPSQFKVITIYQNIKEYEEEDSLRVIESEEEPLLHPKVSAMLDEFARKCMIQQERESGEILGPLYKEYGERMYSISRSKRSDLAERNQQELSEIWNQIRFHESEKNKIITNFESFLTKKPVLEEEEDSAEREEIG